MKKGKKRKLVIGGVILIVLAVAITLGLYCFCISDFRLKSSDF